MLNQTSNPTHNIHIAYPCVKKKLSCSTNNDYDMAFYERYGTLVHLCEFMGLIHLFEFMGPIHLCEFKGPTHLCEFMGLIHLCEFMGSIGPINPHDQLLDH